MPAWLYSSEKIEQWLQLMNKWQEKDVSQVIAEAPTATNIAELTQAMYNITTILGIIIVIW
jgi:hypothetical protein